MARLPTVGDDDNTWGGILNTYLSVSLDTDGTIKSSAIPVQSDNNYDDNAVTALGQVTLPAVGTLTTGSNALDLTNLTGKEYNPYDMASGALTLTAAASPIRGGCAYGIIIADGATTPTVSAFTLLSGTYDNTNDVENHFLVIRKLNASGVETNYLQWIQP